MARTAAVSPSQILAAIEVIQLANPGVTVTASMLREHFGVGHLKTYQDRLDALRDSGQLDTKTDPLVEVLLAQALEHATALRQALHEPYMKKLAALEAELESQKNTHRAKLAEYQADLKTMHQQLDTQQQATAAAEARASNAQAERISAQEALANALRELQQAARVQASLEADRDRLRTALDNAQQQVALSNQALGQANHEKEQATVRAQAQAHQEKQELRTEIQRLRNEQEKDRRTLRDQHDERTQLTAALAEAQAQLKELAPIAGELKTLQASFAALTQAHEALKTEHAQLAARAGEVQALAHRGHRLLLTLSGEAYEAPLSVPLPDDAVLKGAKLEGKRVVFPFLDLSVPLKSLKPAAPWLRDQLGSQQAGNRA